MNSVWEISGQYSTASSAIWQPFHDSCTDAYGALSFYDRQLWNIFNGQMNYNCKYWSEIEWTMFIICCLYCKINYTYYLLITTPSSLSSFQENDMEKKLCTHQSEIKIYRCDPESNQSHSCKVGCCLWNWYIGIYKFPEEIITANLSERCDWSLDLFLYEKFSNLMCKWQTFKNGCILRKKNGTQFQNHLWVQDLYFLWSL